MLDSFLLASMFGQYLDICPYQNKDIFSSLVHFLFMTLKTSLSSPAFPRYLLFTPTGVISVIVLCKFLALSSPSFEIPGHWITSGLRVF